MPVKAIEMVREIRDKIYAETKDFSPEEYIRYSNEKAKKLRKELARMKTSAPKYTPTEY